MFIAEPIICPCCNIPMIPEYIAHYNIPNKFVALFVCTHKECRSFFLYECNVIQKHLVPLKPYHRLHQQLPFPEVIKEMSPFYTEIFTEAYTAEEIGLFQVCGVGYRKALEYLIKDYLIYLHPDKTDVYKQLPLGNCIAHHVENTNVKLVAERATWLGNDETHYVRKWEDKDVKDLKQLINITSKWIEQELETRKILEDMPGKK